MTFIQSGGSVPRGGGGVMVPVSTQAQGQLRDRAAGWHNAICGGSFFCRGGTWRLRGPYGCSSTWAEWYTGERAASACKMCLIRAREISKYMTR
jgi:hypothetical protein